ncbi:MAG: sulfatase-like hydrolase/transferase [Mariprofundaceae bacterium]|nr:sulfatase-like hydrolase/transferase [Mariprofundaceae bacterium]
MVIYRIYGKGLNVVLLKHIIYPWLSLVALFTCVTLSYRAVFALYFTDIFAQLSSGQILYALFWGLRFDVAVGLFFALLAWITYRICASFSLPWVYYGLILLPLLMVIQTADMLYFQDAGRHIGLEILSAGGDGWQLFNHALHTGLTLMICNLLLLCVWLGLAYRWLSKVSLEQPLVMTMPQRVCTWALIIVCSVVGIRGVGGVPQAPIHAYQIGQSEQAVIASNAAYITLFILFAEQENMTQVVLPAWSGDKDALFADLYPLHSNPENKMKVQHTDLAAKNIVLLFLESWNAAWMRSYNPSFAHDVTPHFDQFRQQAISADLTLAGGHRTVEGVFTTMCSFQNPLGSSIAHSALLNLDYLCLPELLQQQGYQTVFIQGSHRDTGNVGSFAQSLGFQESLGKGQLPSGTLPHNAWGLQDDDLYKVVLDKLDSQTAPFFYAINTTSTHDTILPPHVQPLLQAKSSQDKHINVMAYADQAFGRFMQAFAQTKWAENTIIVVVADHTAQIYSSYLHEYMIPMAIKAPDVAAKMLPYATSQRDIAPTLLELLGLPAAPSFSGKSLLSSPTFFADYYHQQHLGWIEGDVLLDVDLSNAQTRCYA